MKKVIATAKPNPLYRHFNNLRNVTIEAVRINNQIRYYSIEKIKNGKRIRIRTKCLQLSTVKSFFADKRFLKDRPFQEAGNEDFYAVLYRHRKKYKDLFNNQINEHE